jgi:hypothetical protein
MAAAGLGPADVSLEICIAVYRLLFVLFQKRPNCHKPMPHLCAGMNTYTSEVWYNTGRLQVDAKPKTLRETRHERRASTATNSA